jgi:glycosyltransferase involved in cell wall biosynthesis
MNNTPLVSVIMPVYNASLYLQDAVESILNQDYNNLELLIINDGSTDHSEQLILTYSDTRIRYYKNDSNLKLIAT